MKSTFKLTGLADYITLTNAMFGTLSIFFLILAVDDTLSDPYSEGLATKYIWASMLCIFLSAVGDIIDGPVARKYSSQESMNDQQNCDAEAVIRSSPLQRKSSVLRLNVLLVTVDCE